MQGVTKAGYEERTSAGMISDGTAWYNAVVPLSPSHDWHAPQQQLFGIRWVVNHHFSTLSNALHSPPMLGTLSSTSYALHGLCTLALPHTFHPLPCLAPSPARAALHLVGYAP